MTISEVDLHFIDSRYLSKVHPQPRCASGLVVCMRAWGVISMPAVRLPVHSVRGVAAIGCITRQVPTEVGRTLLCGFTDGKVYKS